jgi:UDP-N-acetylglucosamine--dolichyl-phosphate N-acetylglucosaminephosphotransferase
MLHLAKIKRHAKTGDWLECNNLTLMNVLLLHFGPMSEAHLAWLICFTQILGSMVGFLIRYGIVHLVYN